ncbi:M61 metallopeptidase family protein, partial [Natronolimnohabitans innermongolicus]
MHSRVAVLAVVLLLVGTLPAGVASASDATNTPLTDFDTESDPAAGGLEATATTDETDEAAALDDADDILHRTVELRQLPDRPGEFEAEVSVAVPEPLGSLALDLETDADVREADGFESTGDGRYDWDGETDDPTLRVAISADRTGHDDHGHDGWDGYTFHDAGDWGIVQVPTVGVTYQKPESVDIGVDETVTVDGPGATGGHIAVFGPVTEHERTVDGDTIRLVVPEAADLREEPDDVLETLADASERLAVGERATETFLVAAPSGVDWGPRGIQYGDADAWIVDDASLEEASNVWLHEYAHTRQRFTDGDVAADARWLVEAQAEYYAGLLAFEQGLLSFGEFREFLERGERSPHADGALADPATWRDADTDYVKGPLVYGDLDRQLRLATDGDRTLDDIFRQLNAHDGTVTAATFLEALEDAGGAELRERAERYTQTGATPETWSRLEHEDAFGTDGATAAVGLDDDTVTVAGQEWDGWDRSELSGPAAEIGTGDVLAVPSGERVEIPTAVANVGDHAGTVDATLQVDGELVDVDRRVLEADERVPTTLAWKPTDPGIYDVRVGSDRLTVYVRSSPSLTVTDLQAAPERVDLGESVTATATVATAD